jgi:chromosome segregation ATPase
MNVFKIEVENIKITLKEKVKTIMKLNEQINYSEKELKNRDKEINELKENITELDKEKENLISVNKVLEKNIQILTEGKEFEKINLDKANYEIEKLIKICTEQDYYIRTLNDQNTLIIKKNDEINYELKSLVTKIKTKEENNNFLSIQVEDYNNRINSREVK